MTEFIKFAGAAGALAAALIISFEYEKYLNERLSVSRGFLALLSHIRSEIDCFLTPLGEIMSGFENSALSAAGYMGLAKTKGLSDAFFEMRERLPLSDEIKKILSDFFDKLGREYKEGTIRLTDKAISDLSAELSRLSSEKERSVKLVRTLCVASALGVVILLL